MGAKPVRTDNLKVNFSGFKFRCNLTAPAYGESNCVNT